MKEETENVSANQRSRQPLLAMNHFKKIQHIFKTTREHEVEKVERG
jgi:hypothetical protein